MSRAPILTAVVLAAVFLLLAAVAGYAYYREDQDLNSALIELASSTAQARALSDSLAALTQERNALQDALTTEQNKNQVFEDQINDIGKTVGQLNKLAKTDPQLLAKYSKVYFLNENYVPSTLKDIDPKYLFEPDRKFQIHGKVEGSLYEMLDDARDDGIDLQVASAYRSFGTQAALKSSYKVTYGAGTANSFSAEQGYSEHQLGTALDFTTAAVGGTFVGFEKDDAYEWLVNNAYKYGFILSYPKSNTYYQYEPWHWRFVGVDLATKLHNDDMYFYDMDQREINTYLVMLFD